MPGVNADIDREEASLAGQGGKAPAIRHIHVQTLRPAPRRFPIGDLVGDHEPTPGTQDAAYLNEACLQVGPEVGGLEGRRHVEESIAERQVVHRTLQDPKTAGDNGGAVETAGRLNRLGGVVDTGHLTTSPRKDPGDGPASAAADVEHLVTGVNPRRLQPPPVQAGVPDVHAAQQQTPGQGGGTGELGAGRRGLLPAQARTPMTGFHSRGMRSLM